MAAVVSFGVGLRPEAAFVLGAIVSATDPAAVVATFDRLGAPRRLISIVEAESLLNDGTGIALLAVTLVAAGSAVDTAAAMVSFVLILAISSAIGIASGAAAGLLAARTNSVTLGLGASLLAAYGGYVLAARLGDSGLLAAVAAGLTFGLVARSMSVLKVGVRAVRVAIPAAIASGFPESVPA